MRLTFFMLAWLALASGCTRTPPPADVPPVKVESLSALQGHLRDHKANLEQFRSRGPFAVTVEKNRELVLSSAERINTDLYLSASRDKAPLVIFMHGYDSTKEAHANQAMHVASWGMHALAVQLAGSGQWVSNGRTLARIANHIRSQPEIIDSRVDANKIILVGHSFGGASVAIALAYGAPAAGGILLDPAAIGRDLPKSLQQISAPLMLLGADQQVSRTRNRDYFYRFVRSGIAEVSIRDASHEDAQFPSEYALRNSGIEFGTTEESQITFTSALTSAAFSLFLGGNFDYAWASFEDAIASGKFINARRK